MLHPVIAARRADHSQHRGYLVPECRDCTSPAAIAARRDRRADRIARQLKAWTPEADR